MTKNKKRKQAENDFANMLIAELTARVALLFAIALSSLAVLLFVITMIMRG